MAAAPGYLCSVWCPGGIHPSFPLGGNTLPPPLLSNSRVYAREGREAKRHLSAAPQIFRRMVDVLTTVERRRCARVCMCDALYARNAEKPQFARARRTRDDPQLRAVTTRWIVVARSLWPCLP